MSARYNLLYHIIIILSIAGLLLPGFSFAQNQPSTPPETLEGTKTIGEKILKDLPQALKEPWQEAMRVWGKMADIWSGWWNSYILPWLKSFWQNIKAPLIKEMERRKPIIEEEFEKEKKEIKEEIKIEASKTGKSLWDRFKELIR